MIWYIAALVVVAVGCFIGGVLFGRNNTKTVEKVVKTAGAVEQKIEDVKEAVEK